MHKFDHLSSSNDSIFSRQAGLLMLRLNINFSNI